ncbi:hypothetical protein GALMADRAFT_134660 [Galerina marginata CBS 339.88]|uniref:Uncharacterized protein n=1 Tax=Galerina marginata (strain CBS 339.88) TaxID=685588 RepID=A0A067TVY8_GALM3|nr:hypothetical protein GALMADRAFT_134660 [Galerina marginata CBS 339.88]
MREDSHLLQTRAYIRNLMVTDRAGLSHFFRPDALGDSQLETQRENETGLAKILHYENLFFFLRFLRKYRGFEELFDHKLELTTRLSAISHKEKYGHYATSQNSAWTDIQAEYNVVPFYFAGKGNDRHIFIFQWVNNFLMFFQGVARVQQPYTFGGTFYTHPLIFDYVTVSTRIDLHKVFELNEGLGPAIQKKFSEIIQFITDDLVRQISSPNFREPNLLFYITALYLHATRRPFHHSLYDLLSAMRAYKQRTIDLGMASPIIEESYGRNLDPYDIRFSRKWWEFLKYPRVRDRSVSNASRDPNIVETGGPPSRHG